MKAEVEHVDGQNMQLRIPLAAKNEYIKSICQSLNEKAEIMALNEYGSDFKFKPGR